jgi:hypothetical protein
MKIIKLSITLYIIAIVTIIIFNITPYGFFDDSIDGQMHHIIMNGWGEYKIRYWLSFQKPVIIETGTYSDPRDNEITLTPQNGLTYKIRVWARDTKRPQYRIKP